MSKKTENSERQNYEKMIKKWQINQSFFSFWEGKKAKVFYILGII